MLTIDNLFFRYDDVDIINNFNLRVDQGEMLALVGPNGTGKTTLIKLISGVLKPERGSIKVFNNDLSSIKPSDRGKLVSVVPQNPLLPLDFRVLDLVMMGRNPYLGLLQWEGKKDVAIARWAMSVTKVCHLENRLINTLSGGERQRVLIAMSLTQKAPLILLDEPTSNLDLGHQTGVMDLIKSVQQEMCVTVIMAMHDLTLAAQYSKRLIILTKNRPMIDGTPENILTSEILSDIYQTSVGILTNPQQGTPVVIPLSDYLATDG